MRDVGPRHPGDTAPMDIGGQASPTLIHAPPPAASHLHGSDASTPSLAMLGQLPPMAGLEVPQGRGPSLSGPGSPQGPSAAQAMGAEVLGKIAHILRLEQVYALNHNPYPFNASITKAHAIGFLPHIAKQVGDSAVLERLAQTVLLFEHKDTHPLSRLLLLHRLSLCPQELREAVALFAPMLFRKLTSVLERASLLALLQEKVHGHDVEDFCRIVMLFGDPPTAYVGATALGRAESIEALVTLMTQDTTTVGKTPALVNAANVAALGPVYWPNLEQALQILGSIDDLTTLPQGLSTFFARNRHATDEWERTAHRVAQTCYRLQTTTGRPPLKEAQMGQRVLDFLEAFGGDTSDPSEDPVPTYTAEP